MTKMDGAENESLLAVSVNLKVDEKNIKKLCWEKKNFFNYFLKQKKKKKESRFL